ncbi:hypothetical protein HYQ46_009251 [Verticillium longisporum]|nr:hypothetical protein HYQ46_009251 [Verticillium longisporum]
MSWTPSTTDWRSGGALRFSSVTRGASAGFCAASDSDSAFSWGQFGFSEFISREMGWSNMETENSYVRANTSSTAPSFSSHSSRVVSPLARSGHPSAI